ncbi:MAG: hypothetical protein LKE33_04740 [Acidaminococcus sp.]|jgi:hypothetical protein|nr:hypothetical protein [Acidaminococcus sp.]MCI2100102.1 hypothetical protein [Acidaminococcus sp.]MCI2114379.1 hypothetical protein [Acidaminococcus sp.]MCI2116316.1 hypothetical protein [Acidaminococcus sp.]
MKLQWKKLAAGAMLLSMCAVPAAFAAERGPLADGEIFATNQVAKSGHVLYKDKTDRSKWTHNGDVKPDGFVGTAFVPDILGATDSSEPAIDAIKKSTHTTEKIKAAEKKYSGKDYAKSLVVYAAMNTNGNDGDLAIQKVELLGRLLNVTVAIKDSAAPAADGSEALYKDQAVVIPLKKLPKYGSLRVRFVDTTGHGLEDVDVSLGL